MKDDLFVQFFFSENIVTKHNASLIYLYGEANLCLFNIYCINYTIKKTIYSQ